MSSYALTYREVHSLPSWLTKRILVAYCKMSGIPVLSKANRGELVEAIGKSIEARGEGVRQDSYVIDFGPVMGQESAKTPTGAVIPTTSTVEVVEKAPIDSMTPKSVEEVPRVLQAPPQKVGLSANDLQTVLTTVFAQLNTLLEQVLLRQQNAFLEQVSTLSNLIDSFSKALHLAKKVPTARVADAVASSSSAPVSEISLFSGDVEKVDPFEWLQSFSMLASKEKWDEKRKLHSFSSYLKGDALDKWRELTDGEKVTWESAKAAWSKRLLDENGACFSQQLADLKQGQMSIAAYTKEFLRLANCASFSATLQTVSNDNWLLCRQYINGLNSLIQKEIHLEEESFVWTLSNVSAVAEKVEVSFSQSTGLCLKNTAGLDAGQCESSGSQVENAAHVGDGLKRRQVTCYKCSGLGHLRRQCPSPRGQLANGQKGSQRLKGWKKNVFEKEAHRKSSLKKAKVHFSSTLDNGHSNGQSWDNWLPASGGSAASLVSSSAGPSMSFEQPRKNVRGGGGKVAQRFGRIPYVRGKVNGKNASLMIDSGAYTSMISRKLAQKLVNWRSIRRTSAKPRALNGDLLQLDGEVEVDLSVGDIAVKHTFLVIAHSNIDAVLGMDFLEDGDGSRFAYCLGLSRQSQNVSISGACLDYSVIGSLMPLTAPKYFDKCHANSGW